MADMTLREELVEVLVAHVERDRYPSTTMMNQIERSLTERLHGRYVRILLDKLNADHFPSPDLARRVASLVR